MESKFKRNLVINSVISLLILCISSTASFLSIKSLLESQSWVSHTYEVIYNLNQGESMLLSSQNSVRGFLFTGNESFLEQYATGENQSAVFFNKAEQLTVDNVKQQKNIVKLKALRLEFFDYLRKRVADKEQGLPVLSENLNTGKKLMDDLALLLKQMVSEEQGLLIVRTSAAKKNSVFSMTLIVTAAFLALLITISFFIKMLKDNKQRVRLYRELEFNERETTRRIKVISHIAGEISQGNYHVRINDQEKDSLGNVAVSLNNMAYALEDSFGQLSDKEWLQSGIAQLNKVMIGDKKLDVLTRDITHFIAQYTQSSAAVLYVRDGNELYCTAGYSYIPEKEREKIALGDGLTGQAAVQRKILELKSITADNITISYALGEIKPRHVIAVPLVDIDTAGVLELAAVKEYTAMDMEFLAIASHNIAIALISAQNRKKLQELLEETQAQSEELMAQHTELESVNAELESQTEKLQASEEELKVQHEELQQTNEELSQRGILLEESNVEIRKKSQELAQSTRYKSEFLANMSHELRTPLNSILLLSRLLSENNTDNMNEEQIEFAKVIESSGKGLLTLIDEILDLSQIEAGKMQLEFKKVSTGEISKNLTDLFKVVARERNITFSIECKEDYMVETDIQRLEQILKNLISNAIKFTSEGSVTVTIQRDLTDSQKICFLVKDTGIGIPAEKLGNIFEAFHQGDGSTKRKFGGTGLGLSISRELAKLLHATISVKSEQGDGSEFMLTVPIDRSIDDKQSFTADNHLLTGQNENDILPIEVKDSDEHLSLHVPEEIEDDRNKTDSQDKVILIVEDDIHFAESLLRFTRSKGYRGIVCVNGAHAIDFVLLYKPVGILLDIELPKKNGWQIMEELKADSATRHIPVHIMSSHKVKQKSLLGGAVHFLEKPVAYEQLPDVFERIEYLIHNESRKVLIIEDNEKHAKALSSFLETYNINSEIKSGIKEGINALSQKNVDCVILDMGIPYNQAYSVLDSVKQTPGLENLPIIVFTGKGLSLEEEAKIRKYADSIIVKTSNSYRRLLDEVSLFLHLMQEQSLAGDKMKKKKGLPFDILENKKVLLVDDDIRNIYSLTKILEDLKMHVVTALDGREALAVLDHTVDIDIVLLDMMMPNMDGYETARNIRQNESNKHLPIIAVTAKAMTGDREKCIEAGASDYISKPIDADQLPSLLRVWLYDKI